MDFLQGIETEQSHRMAKQDFLRSAENFLERLKQASSNDAIHELWRMTSIPYKPLSKDPYSSQYKEEMLSLYRELTQTDYDVTNEWTSSKQSPEIFEIGYPWVSKNYSVIADEIAKPIQVLRALHDMQLKDASIIEFGSGWGNLSLPLAKAGANITIVDIDQGFIDRALRIAGKDGLALDHRCGDFLEVAKIEKKRFDVAIFQSSFHHCLEFVDLVSTIKSCVLKEDGVILFVNEPITRDLNFPWGLRYDGESLWAIMCNQWLELGFHYDFFVEMLLKGGFLPKKLDGIPGLLGDGWKALQGEGGIPFRDLILPSSYDSTFHQAENIVSGRFCRTESTLPQLNGNYDYGLTFVNYGQSRIHFTLSSCGYEEKHSLESAGSMIVQFPAYRDPVNIYSQTFVPDEQVRNGDTRNLGIHLSGLSLVPREN